MQINRFQERLLLVLLCSPWYKGVAKHHSNMSFVVILCHCSVSCCFLASPILLHTEYPGSTLGTKSNNATAPVLSALFHSVGCGLSLMSCIYIYGGFCTLTQKIRVLLTSWKPSMKMEITGKNRKITKAELYNSLAHLLKLSRQLSSPWCQCSFSKGTFILY